MLGRVLGAPRNYFEHSVIALTCRRLSRNITTSRGRRGTAALSTPQYGAVRNVSWYERECHVEGDAKGRPIVLSNPSATSNTSSEELAREFIDFLRRHGQTTDSALRCLNSGSTVFSPILHIISTRPEVRRIAKELAASDNPAACIRLLSLAIANGCHLNAPIYEDVCWTLSHHKRYRVILEIFRLAKENLNSLTCRLLDWRLRAFLELENYAAFRSVFRDYKDAHVNPSRRTWHIILVAQLRNRSVAAARQCLSTMEGAGFPMDAATHTVIAENYHYLGLDRQVKDLAIAILDDLPPFKRVFVVNQLLESHLRVNDQPGFHELLSFFDAELIGPVRDILNLSDNFENPHANSSSMRPHASLPPSAQTFLIVIRLCMIHSNFVGAEHIFSLLAQRGAELSPVILAAYMDLQFALGKSHIAMYLMSQVLSNKDFDGLFDQWDQHSDLQSDWKWPFSTVRIPPHVDIFNALLRGIINIRGLDGARRVFELMQRVDIKPDSHSVKILTDHLIRSERATPAAVLRVLRQLFPVFRVTLRHIHPLISRILRREKQRLYYSSVPQSPTMARVEVLKEVNRPSDGPLAGVPFERFLVRPSLAHSLIASLESREIRSDAAMLALRIRYEGTIKRDTEEAVETYTDMLSRGITPSVYHISALMEGFTRRGEMDMALKVMHSAREYNMKPNLVMYTILLHGYGHQNQPKAAAELFKVMISSGLHPDVRAIYALCNAFVLARRLDTAKQMLVTLWPYIEPVPRDHLTTPLLQLLKRFCKLDAEHATSRRAMTRKKRALLQRQLAVVVKAYKHSLSLPEELIPNYSRVRHLVKKLHYANRKV